MAHTPSSSTSASSSASSCTGGTPYSSLSCATTPPPMFDTVEASRSALRELHTKQSSTSFNESKKNRKYLRAILDKRDDDRIIKWLQPSDYGVTPSQPIASLFRRTNIKQCDYITHEEDMCHEPGLGTVTPRRVSGPINIRGRLSDDLTRPIT